MSNFQKARELEHLRYSKVLNDCLADQQRRITEIDGDMARRGLTQSIPRAMALWQARAETTRLIAQGQIQIRRELIGPFPELGTPHELDALFQKIEQGVTAFEKAPAQHHDLPRGSQAPVTRYVQQEASRIRAEVKRDIEILKREAALNLQKQHGEVPTVSVSTGGGPAIVNLGKIYGDVQQVIGNVGAGGQSGDLASLLSQLASAINAAETLGEQRVRNLEQVRFIAEQATAPPDKRQASVVEGLMIGLRASLQHVAEIASILALAGPSIARHFGFSWPF